MSVAAETDRISSDSSGRIRLLGSGRWPLFLLLLAHVPLSGIFFWSRVQQGSWQAGPLALLAVVVFYWLRCSSRVRWTRLCSLFLVLDVLCLLIGSVADSPWLVSTGLVFLTAAWGLSSIDITGDRSLFLLSLLPLSVTGFPDVVNAELGTRIMSGITSLTSILSTRLEIIHYREGVVLGGVKGAVDLSELCGSGLAWYPLLLITLIWLISQRRSLVQSICLLVCVVPILVASLVVTGSLVLGLVLSGSQFFVSSVWVAGLLLVVGCVLMFCADALLLFVTAPVAGPEDTGDENVMRNPMSTWWNVVVSAVPVMPLAFEPAAIVRIPGPLRNICLFLIPIVLVMQCWSFLNSRS